MFLEGFFVGIAQCRQCGSGARVEVSHVLQYHFYWSCGIGTNNKAEVISLWWPVYCAKRLNIELTHIFGDSRFAIDWINGKASLATPLLLC